MITVTNERLGTLAAQLDASYVQFGFYEGSAEATQVAYRAPAGDDDADPTSHPVHCSIKLLTATLLGVLARSAGVAAHMRLGELLPSLTSAPDAPAGDVRVAHLLAHCHGLADILPGRDVPIECLPRLFAPGKFYSYGSTGYLLLGRLVEQLTGEPFERLLYGWLRDCIAGSRTRQRLACALSDNAVPPVCPAAGSGLSLAVEDLLAFSRIFTGGACEAYGLASSWVEEMLRPAVAMPGWSPFIKASSYGFRCFGQGWFGHNGLNRRCLTYLRIHPARRAAICVIARGRRDNLGMLPAALLREGLPELVDLSDPPPRIDVDKVLADTARVFGCYTDFVFRYEVYGENGRLKLRILNDAERSPPACLHDCFLYPAEREVYFLAKPWRRMTSVQLIEDADSGAQYLWSLDQLIPRVEHIPHLQKSMKSEAAIA